LTAGDGPGRLASGRGEAQGRAVRRESMTDEKTKPSDGRERPGPALTNDILTAVGEVVYEWSIPDDTIRWGENALDVLGLAAPGQIATGRSFAALLDPANPTSRHDVVLNGTGSDDGRGVAYQVQYSLLPEGRGTTRRLWIEDIGRWYAGSDGHPAWAHGVLRVINERYEREQRLAFLSRYDELTGFFNRPHLLATLSDAIQHAKRFRSSVAFILVAIDNFRAINEAYGFDIADQILAATARRIKSQLRSGDAIGRYSGSKLGLVLMNCDESDMVAAAERFHAAVRNEVVTTEAGAVAVTISLGGVTLPRHGRTTHEAMTRAQEALHLARLRGVGRFVAFAFSPSRQAERRGNAALSSELVAALGQRRLKLAFQPVVDIVARRPAFYEALVRLKNPDGTLITASEFIPLSERLGLIRLIDHRVIELALEALVSAPSVTVSINVSAETVGDSEWIAHLSGALSGRRDLARRLIVEITETAVISNIEEAAHFVAMLHGFGCRVAIDDFGAGFSSFRTLRELDIDLIKIDGAFVKDLARNRDDQVFVKALIELARNFEMTTVAEWVRDEETAALLAGWGVSHIQGDLVGEPALDWPPVETGGG
jgi:diguanylate cyclase (GGDEF)-like protein